MECINASMIGNKTFALINTIIYQKCKHFLIIAYIHRQQSIVTHLGKIVTILKKSKLHSVFLGLKLQKSCSAAVSFVLYNHPFFYFKQAPFFFLYSPRFFVLYSDTASLKNILSQMHVVKCIYQTALSILLIVIKT